MTACAAIIVAAGRGQRFGGDGPKQYQSLAGEPLLRRTLRAFCSHPRIDAVVPVIHGDDTLLYAEAAAGIVNAHKLRAAVIGGAARQDSVRNGLEALAAASPRIVLIHDGARPVVAASLIDAVIDGLTHAEGAIPALPVVDTLKRIQGKDAIGATVARAGLVRAQTPQGFRYPAILAAHRSATGHNLTDDAAVMEQAGHRVVIVPGAEANIKVTTMDDLARLNDMISETRTGQGFDVHKFGPGDGVWLCGVKIPHDHGLDGHSDADVALHAATDAILGAIGAGDIGQHFPPSDPSYRGVSSDRFIKHAYDLLRARGGMLVHLDLTIICERPKVGPHRARLVARIAEILGIDPQRVSVKATTTEGLGFTGRQEGIAAQAVATVRVAG
ncbi:MAG: bifunctional 2-C-methyl-D-erythritol 4-phosphate cytidylyltransferase/2-C-methyl-D-erythritol 2,4-cyclodiphosphate synthase [Rhodospirillaceae bacterium]|nr:MAG: bifunctional 2-C-methyl-D-erythritol 4-phosphate cytidylyltransferase/2-C-methyl-D-erythritol 2,4-cyclodiphosphate synthase [Rhodospirillaceae bacterium]